MARHRGRLPLGRYLTAAAAVVAVQAISVYVMTNWVASRAAENQVQPERAPEAAYHAPADLEKEDLYVQLDPIVVNPRGTGGMRFLFVQIDLRCASGRVISEIENWHLASKIRDRVTGLLESKTLGLLSPENTPALKDETRLALNRILGKGAIVDVYFRDFVIQ